MSKRRLLDIPSFQAVAAGQTAVLDLPTNRRYHAVYLQYKTNANQATIEADIDEVRIVINGRVQRRFSAAQLNAILAFQGIAFTAGFLPLLFSDPQMRSGVAEDLYSWGMSNVDTFQIEVDVNGAALAPTLGGFQVVDNVVQPLAGIVKWRQRTVGVTTVGVRTVTDFQKSEPFRRIHCFETAANDITNIEIQLDQFEVFKLSRVQNNLYLAHASKPFSPQADIFHVTFDQKLLPDANLPTLRADGLRVSELRLDFTMALANDFTVLTETVGNPD